jgi:hypothetical protein
MFALSTGQETAISIVTVTFGTLLLGWVSLLWYRHESRKRELKHTERMKAFELGLPVPDAEVARANAAGFLGVAVPLIMIGGALLASNLALHAPADSFVALGLQTKDVFVPVWLFSGAVSLMAVFGSLRVLRRSHAHKGFGCHHDQHPGEALEGRGGRPIRMV